MCYYNRLFSKLAVGRKMQGLPMRKTAAYKSVCEDLSTGATPHFAATVEVVKKSNKVFMASFFGLALIGINAWADDAPVVDLNTLPDDAALFSSTTNTFSAPTSAAPALDTIAARQSLPMDQRIHLLEQQISNFTQMNLPAKIDGLEQQINQLNGQLEEQVHTISQLQDQQKQLQQTTVVDTATMGQASSRLADKMGVKLPSPALTAPVTPIATRKRSDHSVTKGTGLETSFSPIVAAETAVVQNKPSAQSLDTSATTATADSDEKAYQAAFDLMVKKKNTAAIAGFKTFLKNYPNSPAYAPSAHYWLGELYGASNMSALASKEFTTVIQQYPTHAKVPDAMLKLAIIHDDAGQHAQAKQELQKVVKQFPDSTAAKLAKMRLQTMKLG